MLFLKILVGQSMKRQTIQNYQLQFGRALPLRHFNIPNMVLVSRRNVCLNRRPQADSRWECKRCYTCCHVMGLRCIRCHKMEERPYDFHEFANVQRVQGGGLLTAVYDKTYRFMCSLCVAKTMVPWGRTGMRCLPRKQGGYILELVLSLNGCSFPPAWARRRFRGNAFFDWTNDAGQRYNHWNGVLETAIEAVEGMIREEEHGRRVNDFKIVFCCE